MATATTSNDPTGRPTSTTAATVVAAIIRHSPARWSDLDHDILARIFQYISEKPTGLFRHISRVCRAWRYVCWEVLFWIRPVAALVLFFPFDNVHVSRLSSLRSVVEGDTLYGKPPLWWHESRRFGRRELVLLSVLTRSPESHWAELVELVEDS